MGRGAAGMGGGAAVVGEEDVGVGDDTRQGGQARESGVAWKHEREELVGQAVRAEQSGARRGGQELILFFYLFRRVAHAVVT